MLQKVLAVIFSILFIIFFIANFFIFMAIMGTIVFIGIVALIINYFRVKKSIKKSSFDGSNFYFYTSGTSFNKDKKDHEKNKEDIIIDVKEIKK